jgi:glutathione S-transferase
MKAVLAQLERVIDTRATVCIEGETGTGKELIASAVHYQSSRRDKVFVAQNCAALPENLLESELFGHKRGAFTSADSDKKGLFEIADGGTLFLDEMGEMPVALQAKLLRVLQEGTIRAVGATSEKQVDVRIICATNRDLSAEVEKGRFRQDLYYRLMVFPIKLPPLRDRREDIPQLAAHFLKRYAGEYRVELPGFTQDALDALASYNWPGNIRELENEVQRLVIQAESGHWIEVTDLSSRLRKIEGTVTRIAPKQGTLKEMMEQVERWLIAEALRDHGGNKTKTAATLGITRGWIDTAPPRIEYSSHMSLTLFVGNKRYSSWSLRPYLALAHAGVAFETRAILLDRDDTAANIAKVTPAGRVPVLHHDGFAIWESLAICEYVAEHAPDAKLWPSERQHRARARTIATEMHSGFAALRRDMPMDLIASKPGIGHTAEALADGRRVIAIWREALAASGGPFLFGAFTIADAMFAPVTTRFTTYGVELDATCRAYAHEIAALPAFQRWRADAETEPARRD